MWIIVVGGLRRYLDALARELMARARGDESQDDSTRPACP